MRTARWTGRALAVVLALAVAGPAGAQDEGPDGGGPDVDAGPVGTWRFREEARPVKAVIVGGSVAAWRKGNFGQFLEAACPRVEVVNRAKARLGALALKQRFERQVLQNRRVDAAAHEEAWLIFNGGLNSIGTPERTNRQVAELLRLAHRGGFRTLVLSLGPWGDEQDRRWRGLDGLRYQDLTRRAVDFVLGRLRPAEAFDKPLDGGDPGAFPPGALPDVAVDLYDSDLRDRDAALRDEAVTRRLVERDRGVQRELAGLDEAARAARLEALVAQARELPRWYLRRELRAFDHIHPNLEGHRVMAREACPKLPASWGCDCAAIDAMRWSPADGGLAPRVQAASAR